MPAVIVLDGPDRLRPWLEAAGLPVSDLGAASPTRWLGLDDGGSLIGGVGLEWHAPDALLRSLVVRADRRREGHGARLVAAAQAAARAHGVDALYCLTLDVAPFFRALGWAPVDRADVPAAIRGTTQFAGVCPASATVLRRSLRDDAPA